jgi:S-adenosylmethionine/arginine decarboxylase-like enzyme
MEKKGVVIDDDLVKKDDEVIARYDEEGPWGISVSIDLHECDLALIKNEEKVKQFAHDLVEFIDMKAYKGPHVMNFGDNKRVSGLSMFQFIETSCISGHYANNTKSAYIDIFSCSKFRPHEAAAFCKKYFKAIQMSVQINFRS